MDFCVGVTESQGFQSGKTGCRCETNEARQSPVIMDLNYNH
jgi:hypothetical protein